MLKLAMNPHDAHAIPANSQFAIIGISHCDQAQTPPAPSCGFLAFFALAKSVGPTRLGAKMLTDSCGATWVLSANPLSPEAEPPVFAIQGLCSNDAACLLLACARAQDSHGFSDISTLAALIAEQAKAEGAQNLLLPKIRPR